MDDLTGMVRFFLGIAIGMVLQGTIQIFLIREMVQAWGEYFDGRG